MFIIYLLKDFFNIILENVNIGPVSPKWFLYMRSATQLQHFSYSSVDSELGTLRRTSRRSQLSNGIFDAVGNIFNMAK